MELGRDAQEELEIERIVMRLEGPRRRAADERVQRRRLDLEKSLAVEKIAQPLNDELRARITAAASGFATKST